MSSSPARSIAALQRWNDPETRQRVVAGIVAAGERRRKRQVREVSCGWPSCHVTWQTYQSDASVRKLPLCAEHRAALKNLGIRLQGFGRVLAEPDRIYATRCAGPIALQALIFETAHRRCGACGVPLVFGERGRVWFMDHIVPIYKGGLTTRANLMPLCRPCHVAKTRPEIQEIRKLRPNTSKRYWQTHAQKDAEIAALRADVGELTKAVVMLFYLTARR